MALHDRSEIRDWVIYKITNPNGRIYIGKTHNLHNRKKQYRYVAHKNQMLIYRSIIKYGWDAHTFEVIDNFKSNTGYCAGKEMFWVRTYMSNYKKYPEQKGMNLTDGGEGTIGYKMPEERKKQISAFHKGKQHLLGFKMSKETLEKRRNSVLGKPLNPDKVKIRTVKMIAVIGRRIIQYDINGNKIDEHPTIAVAINKSGVSKTHIHRILNGVIKKPRYIFKYKEDIVFHKYKFQRRIFERKQICA
jgi:group I intron endonuclease